MPQGVFTLRSRISRIEAWLAGQSGELSGVQAHEASALLAGADAAVVLSQAGVAGVLVAVLDHPVAAVPGQEAFGASLLGGE